MATAQIDIQGGDALLRDILNNKSDDFTDCQSTTADGLSDNLQMFQSCALSLGWKGGMGGGQGSVGVSPLNICRLHTVSQQMPQTQVV